ncbi:MAG TPA: hypothetical protein VGO67_01045 [Verrucomicrobiae bacterium]|jgi:hypothetical protein
MADNRQAIEFYAFGSKTLVELLNLEVPPFARTKMPFRQLQYVEAYVAALKCATVVVESHYIDRDHIEDHGAFYSRNFISYPNYCTRLHFFSLEAADLKQRMRAAVEVGQKGVAAYKEACQGLSAAGYLGWSVVKPLHGCPVGRTILRTFDSRGEGDYKRTFPCVRRHRSHLMGVELVVDGLPFQQQDTGVSACATTAIWAALHHFRGFEEVAAATPAQITSIASRYSLPFGRSMPSEGLSMEQMCQAIQGMGVSPHLHRATDFNTAQNIIYSATMSGMSSILIIQRDGGTERHAVTVAGIKLAEPFTPVISDGIAEQSAQLTGAYVHDDRWGPYVATLFEKNTNCASLRYLPRGVVKVEEKWVVTHILIPVHPKIRLSFGGLQEVGIEVAKLIQWHCVKELKVAVPDVILDGSILRGHAYVEELLFEKNGFGPVEVERFCSEVSLPRYVGCVRARSPLIGTLDVLVDTTGTVRNLHCAAVVSRTPTAQHAKAIGEFLATRLKACPRPFGIAA